MSSSEGGEAPSAAEDGLPDVQIIKDVEGQSDPSPASLVRKLASHDDFVRLQAILAGLPMHALRGEPGCSGRCCCTSRQGGCFCCCHPRVVAHMPWVLPCNERIEVALLAAKSDYPQFGAQLRRLRVVHASYDLTIFVDDVEKRMFTSLRGTDCGTCRDIGNDVLIFLGCWLCRTKWAKEEYCHTRSLYPDYASYGCGHSLGGTVMTELAHLLEEQEGGRFAFCRVDVFNTGGSPMSRGYSDLKITRFRSHRVRGDLVSRFFQGPGELCEHPQRPEFCSHSLRHFLPEKMPAGFADVLPNAHWVEGCCGGLRHPSEREVVLLVEGEAKVRKGWGQQGEEEREGEEQAQLKKVQGLEVNERGGHYAGTQPCSPSAMRQLSSDPFSRLVAG